VGIVEELVEIWLNEVCDRSLMWKSPEKCLSLGNRTGGLVGNKNRHSITQSVMAKNRSISVLIHYDQKQQHNKEP